MAGISSNGIPTPLPAVNGHACNGENDGSGTALHGTASAKSSTGLMPALSGSSGTLPPRGSGATSLPNSGGWSNGNGDSRQVHALGSGSGMPSGSGTASGSGNASGSLPLPHQQWTPSHSAAGSGNRDQASASTAINGYSHSDSAGNQQQQQQQRQQQHQGQYPCIGGVGTPLPSGAQPPLTSQPSGVAVSGPYGGSAGAARDAAAPGPRAAALAAAAIAGVQLPDAVTGLCERGRGVPRPLLGNGLAATCPLVALVGVGRDGGPSAVLLTLRQLRYDARCYLGTVFVDLQLLVAYPQTWAESPLVLFLPKCHNTTITQIVVDNLTRPSVFTTTVVPMDDARHLAGSSLKSMASDSDPTAIDPNAPPTDPELFMMPLPPGIPGDEYRVSVSFFEPMAFDQGTGQYVLRLPAEVPQACLATGSSINSVLDVSITINTGGSDDVDVLVPSHPVSVTERAPGVVALTLDPETVWDNADVVAGYAVWRDTLCAAVHVEEPEPGAPDQRGTFALSVTPPGPEQSVAFPRSVVFMFDRSGSMSGDPIRFAKAALLNGLHLLGPEDRFTVVAFDHEQLWWTDRLIEATPENILSCMHWVNDDLCARGTTDIHAPLQRALKLLDGTPGLPFVFLLTDGCVDDERDICITAERAVAAAAAGAAAAAAALGSETTDGPKPDDMPAPATPAPAVTAAPRIFAFGIGPYCNHYFLTRLAAAGRGAAGAAFRPGAIQPGVEGLLAAAALPMLSDLQVCVKGLTQVEFYPFPIPDVFVGRPLLVAGKFEGQWPEEVTLLGNLPDGTTWSQSVPTLPAGPLPLQRLFAKSQLDLMTANAWLAGNPEHLVSRIVELSVASGVATPHTAMIGFETTPQRYAQMQATPVAERRKRIARWAIGGAAGVALIGGVVAALGFGDLAGTLSNAPVADAMTGGGGDMGAFFGGLGDGGGDCGCGAECGDGCGECCGACLTC